MSDRIETVKGRIQQLNGIPVERLLFNGKSLQDTETLDDNQIRAGDILETALAELDSPSSRSNQTLVQIQKISETSTSDVNTASLADSTQSKQSQLSITKNYIIIWLDSSPIFATGMDALSFYQIGLEKAEKCYPSQHPLVNRCALDLARIYGYLGQEQHAESILQRHVPTIHDSLPPNHSMQIPYHMYTGHSLLKQGDFSGAHAHFQSALTLDLGHREANHPGGSFIHSAIGMAFGREGRYNEALDAFTTALQVQMATLAPEHPDIASTYIELGKIFELLGNVSEALFNYERGMDIYLKIVPPTDPIIAQTEQHI
ncbi:unnamed protein product, partial [Rotaria sp. Silwood1]